MNTEIDNNSEISESILELDEDEIDEELNLPFLLSSNTSFKDKRKLLHFKHNHTEIEWETEILRLTDLNQKSQDLQRLQSIMKGNAPRDDSNIARKRPRGKVMNFSDDEEEEEEDDEDDDNRHILDDMSEVDSDDDDLFDSDEEEYHSSKFSKSQETATGISDSSGIQVTEKKRITRGLLRKSNKKIRTTNGDDEEEEDGDEYDNVEDRDDDDDSDEDYRGGKNRRGTTTASSTSQLKKKAVMTSSASSTAISPKKKSALEMYTADEDEEEEEYAERSEQPEGRRRMVVDDEEEDEDEVDTSPEAGLSEYIKIQIKRYMLLKWLHEPYLESAILHNYVKLSLGNNPTTGEPVYLMAEIVAVRFGTGRSYKVDGIKTTDLRLVLSIGGTLKPFRIQMISNERLKEVDVIKYIHALKEKNITPITVNEALKKRKQLIEVTRHHRYTNEEIQQMISKRRGFNKAATTNFTTALESLSKKLREAHSANDFTTAELLRRQIEKLERKIEEEKVVVKKFSHIQVSLNKRNKEQNYMKDLKAGLKRKLQSEGDSKNPLAAKSTAEQDPFVRRETRPLNIWKTGALLETAKQIETLKLKLDKLKAASNSNNNNTNVTTDGSSSYDGEIRRLEKQLKELEEKEKNGQDEKKTTKESTTTTGDKKIDGNNNSNVTMIGKKSSTMIPLIDERVVEWKPTQDLINEIREKVKKRLGVDPLEKIFAYKTPRERYLSEVCKGLPEMFSEERNRMRNGLTLFEYEKMK